MAGWQRPRGQDLDCFEGLAREIGLALWRHRNVRSTSSDRAV